MIKFISAMFALFCFNLFSETYSQITLNQQDVEDFFTPGKSWLTLSNYEVNGSENMNIGSASNSIPQNWQITDLDYPDTMTTINITPASTGYQQYFPSATHCTKASGPFLNYTMEIYQFFHINSSGLWDAGSLQHVYGDDLDTILYTQLNELVMPLPVTIGTTYQEMYDSTDGGFGIYNVEETISTCDAFGNISFFGNNEQALRIKKATAHRVYQNGSLINTWYQHEYQWFTKSKGFVTMDADTSTILSGNVPIQTIEVTLIGTATNVADNTNELESFYLDQNYPNPFNPSTTISYKLSANAMVSLKVFDVLGKEVAELINKEQTAGAYSINFNAAELSSGIYFYRLEAGTFVETKSMMLIK
jgi:hypothetical protein